MQRSTVVHHLHSAMLFARRRTDGFGTWAKMGKFQLALLLTFGFSLLGVVGDYFLKVASAADKPFQTVAFYLGFAVYASTAFGWLFAMRHLKLATISTVYSVSIILLLTTVGVVFFNERLRATEVVGIAMALASLVLLIRFS